MKFRAWALLASVPALFLMAPGPRATGVFKAPVARHHDSRRPKLPRHLLPAKPRELESTRKATPFPQHAADLAQDGLAGRAVSGSAGRMPLRAFSALTKPDYLQTFKHPRRESSPPS
jgi:hypothetical protein